MAERHAQRRLAAILAADVAGYSRLIEADEEGTRTRLRSLHAELIDPRIAADGGRIVKTTGDGILVEFPSAVAAVRNALDIQSAMAGRDNSLPEDRRIMFRVGINIGDVLVEGDDIHGDGVNVAARLEGLCGPGEVYVSGAVYDQTAGKLVASFEDLGEQTVKNISEPVRCYRVQLETSDTPMHRVQQIGTPRPISDIPSIAVLPFDNLSADPEQEYFSDGMAEDLITDLSKISNLSVAARNSSFSFKGQMSDVRDVAKKLGVAFVLEGSVRKMGERLRINAQLIDAGDGNHLWAERYDGNMAEIFDFQDRIRGEIVAALELKLTPTDHARTGKRQTKNVEAYDFYLKGREQFFRFTPEAMADSYKCLKNAIELDPEFSDAHSYLSYWYFSVFAQEWPGLTGTLEQALASAETAVDLDDRSALAYTRLGWVQGFMKHFDEAVESFETALSLEPDFAEAYSYYGQILNFAGDPEKGFKLCERALQLDPYAPIAWKFSLGESYYELGRLEESISILREVLDQVPRFRVARLMLACAHVEAGQIQKAQDLVAEVKDSIGSFARIAKNFPYKNDDALNRVFDALRKAGLT